LNIRSGVALMRIEWSNAAFDGRSRAGGTGEWYQMRGALLKARYMAGHASRRLYRRRGKAAMLTR
jgi:hypothetical protein